MRVFVAGATGVPGIPLMQRLLSLGHSVVGLTRSREKATLLGCADGRNVRFSR